MATNLAYGFGILGNVVSFLVYLAPAATFYRICKKKSTEQFQAVPYSVSLFSAMLYLYYAFLKGIDSAFLLITINSFGCATQITYLTIFIIYTTKKSRIQCIKMLLLFNVALLGFIIAATYLLANGPQRVQAVGWICAAFSVSVFAAPLSILRKVIKTKSVEFMPLPLSFFLTICAVVWFFYGFLIKDYYIAGPNILGFVFGIIQMILYVVYKNHKDQKKPAVPTADPSKVHDISVEFKTHENNNPVAGQPGDDSDNHQSEEKHELQITVVDEESQEQVAVTGILVEIINS